MTMPPLPHSLDAERAVLASVLLAPRCYPSVAGECEPVDMFHPMHAAILDAMGKLHRAGKAIDSVAVAEAMRGDERFRAHGDMFGVLVEIESAVVSVENVRYHAALVAQKARHRRFIEAAHGIAAGSYGCDDLEEYAQQSITSLSAILRGSQRDGAMHLRQVLRESARELEQRYENRGKTPLERGIVSSGLWALDALLGGGYRPGRLYVIAARPGMGKSALGIQGLVTAGRLGIPGLGFSLEMPRVEQADRMIAARSGVDGERMASGDLAPSDWRRILEAVADLAQLPVWIDHRGGLRIGQIRAEATRWRTDTREGGQHDHALIVVDYLQLAEGEGDKKQANREQDVAGISRGLKALSKALRCPVVALSQLSRECERRPDKRPILADLRESGSIEQDADAVIFPFRPAVYGLPPEKGQAVDEGYAEIIVAKNRGGSLGRKRCRWDGPRTQFHDEEHRP